MPNTELQNKLGLSLAQAQTSNMDAAAYNINYNNSESVKKGDAPARQEISGGIGVGSTGGFNPVDTKSSVNDSNFLSSPVGTQSITPSKSSVSSKSSIPSSVPINVESISNTTYSSGGLSNSNNLLNTSGTKTERVKTGKASYDSLISKRNELMTADPTLGRYDAMKKARGLLKGTTPSVSADPYGLNRPEAKTGIEPLDAELAKLRQDKSDAIKDTFKSYSLAQADYNKNKGYYTNFDATNNTFNSVLGDIQSTLSQTGAPQLSDAETQAIAQKYGITADEVKNPLSIYSKLEMTDEGKQVLGVTDRENQIKDLQTETERKRQDAITQHERNTIALQQSIEDANREMQRNLDWATASGAWSGANRSSGYQQGIQNIKDDTARVVGRIQEQINQSNADTTTYLTRLSEDLSTNMTRAKTALDTDVKNLKFDTGLQLNGLEEKYGTNSRALLKALDAIQEEFGTKSMQAYNNYLSSIKSIQSIADNNLSLIEKMNTVNDAMKNKRYNELISSGLLGNMSLSNIADEVRSGKMDISRYSDLKNLMTKTVVDTLSKSKTLTQADINTIGYLLDSGATPTQIVARLGGGSTIAPTTGLPTLLDMISKAEGTHGNYNAMYGAGAQTDIDLTKMTVKQVQDLQRKRIYQDKNGNWVGGAMGKYQVVSGTLNGLVQRGVVKPTDLFNAETQDKIAMSLMGSSWADYQAGKITPEQFQRKLANVWASVPDPSTGQSVYASDGTNAVTKGGGEIGEFLRNGGSIQANASKNYSQDQKNLMDTITGELTEAKIGTLKAGGLTVQDLANYRASMKAQAGINYEEGVSMSDFTDGEIAQFNSDKYNPQTDKDEKRVKRYYDYQSALASIQSDPNASIVDRMRASRGNKSIVESSNKAYKDLGTVVGQLDRMGAKIKEYNDSKWFGDDLNPIQSLISSNNPWDTKAQEVKAQLSALVPKVARGVFGEVGVLTDSDIQRYIQTLPNIGQTAKVQDVVQLALLETLKGSLDNAVGIDSATYDVSGLIGQYKSLDDKISDLKKKVTGTSNNTLAPVQTAGTGTYSNNKPTNSYFQ